MPSTRPPGPQTDQLPPVATVAEIAAYERVDPRTLRAELEAGQVPGAFRRGRSWRICTAAYLEALSPTSTSPDHGYELSASAQ
jgi:hypothetical protein